MTSTRSQKTLTFHVIEGFLINRASGRKRVVKAEALIRLHMPSKKALMVTRVSDTPEQVKSDVEYSQAAGLTVIAPASSDRDIAYVPALEPRLLGILFTVPPHIRGATEWNPLPGFSSHVHSVLNVEHLKFLVNREYDSLPPAMKDAADASAVVELFLSGSLADFQRSERRAQLNGDWLIFYPF